MSRLEVSSALVQRAAQLLADARTRNLVLDELPHAVRPRTLRDAYAIQDALAARLGWSDEGWFCACVNKDIQQQLGLNEPYHGRAVTQNQFSSPAQLRVDDYPPISLECEFAFRLVCDLPPRPEPYCREEVAIAIAVVHPVIEAVAGYLYDWINQDVFSVVADNGTDGPLIVGPPHKNFPVAELDTIRVTLAVNGCVERTGSGANVGGHPLDALTWLANARSRNGAGLKAGFLHNTGTSTGLYRVSRGDRVTADFGPLGQVKLDLK